MRRILQGLLGSGRRSLRWHFGSKTWHSRARQAQDTFVQLNRCNARSNFQGPASVLLGSLVFIPTAVAALSEGPTPDIDMADLTRLARDLTSSSSPDREAAVSQVSRLTRSSQFLGPLLRAGCLEPLLDVVVNTDVDPRVRVIALKSLADLLALPEACKIAADSSPLFSALADCLGRAEAWTQGPGEGPLGRSEAARALQRLLVSETGLQAALARNGAATRLLERAASVARESAEEGATYASLSAVPGTVDAVNAVEEERELARAVQALSGSEQGVSFMLASPVSQEWLAGVQRWALSRDPALQRAGAGALAAVICTAERYARDVARAGGLRVIVASLGVAEDPQARCFACAAVSKLAEFGGETAAALAAEPGLAQGLLTLAVPRQGAEAEAELRRVAAAAAQRLGVVAAQGGAASLGQEAYENGEGDAGENFSPSFLDRDDVHRGLQRCGLKALVAACRNSELAEHLRKAGAVEAISAELERGGYHGELETMARQIVASLGRRE